MFCVFSLSEADDEEFGNEASAEKLLNSNNSIKFMENILDNYTLQPNQLLQQQQPMGHYCAHQTQQLSQGNQMIPDYNIQDPCAWANNQKHIDQDPQMSSGLNTYQRAYQDHQVTSSFNYPLQQQQQLEAFRHKHWRQARANPYNQQNHQQQNYPYPKYTNVMRAGKCGMNVNKPTLREHLTAQQQQLPQQRQLMGVPMNTVPSDKLSMFLASCPNTIWKFLLELLLDRNFGKLISWTGNGWEFKIIDPEMVSQLWMKKKNKKKMNYDILSRNIRYYYGKGIIEKTEGKEYVYYFALDLQTKVNLTPIQLWKKYNLTPKVVQ